MQQNYGKKDIIRVLGSLFRHPLVLDSPALDLGRMDFYTWRCEPTKWLHKPFPSNDGVDKERILILPGFFQKIIDYLKAVLFVNSIFLSIMLWDFPIVMLAYLTIYYNNYQYHIKYAEII
jgi:hypothetical protein